MWLPKMLYESLPLIYIAIGIAVGIGSQFLADELLSLVLLIAGVCSLVGGLVLILKRRDYRLSRSRLRYDRLDS